MRTSDKGIKFISQWEGFSPTAYMDDNDGYTIGYGHLIQGQDEQWLVGATITKEQALELLKKDVGIAEASVYTWVTAPLNQNQFDALVSLIYNIGGGQFRTSTLRTRINLNDTKERITEAWQRWNKDDGRVVQGLVNRRKAETDLFFTPEDEKKNY